MRLAVTYAVTSRRSIRAFLDRTVPAGTVRDLLAIASRAPSGSNIQPWRVHVLQGAALRRVTDALRAAADRNEPENRDYTYYPKTWRSPYIERRRASGWGLYELAGVERGDREGAKLQSLKNFSFFGAPIGMIFSIDRDLEQGSWLDYGMFLQSLMIAARGFGLDTCPQAAISGYPDLLRRELSIPETQAIVCGIALGWADPAEPVNALDTERSSVDHFSSFHSE